MELWKPVLRFESCYEVSDLGRVRSLMWSGRPRPVPCLKKMYHTRNGYLTVQLSDCGLLESRLVHRLVLESFLGPEPSLFCRHLDGSRDNNVLSNLRWGTKVENAADMIGHGTHRQGEQIPASKLLEEDVLEIRRVYRVYQVGKLKCSNKAELAKKFGVSPGAIRGVVDQRNWRFLLEPSMIKRPRR